MPLTMQINWSESLTKAVEVPTVGCQTVQADNQSNGFGIDHAFHVGILYHGFERRTIEKCTYLMVENVLETT
jgi:hypothetical protein